MVKDNDVCEKTENVKLSYQGDKKPDSYETDKKFTASEFCRNSDAKTFEACHVKSVEPQVVRKSDSANDQLNESNENDQHIGHKVKSAFTSLKDKLDDVLGGGNDKLVKENDKGLDDNKSPANHDHVKDMNVFGTNYYNDDKKERSQKLENAEHYDQIVDDSNDESTLISMAKEGFYDLKDKLVEIGEHVATIAESPKEESIIEKPEKSQLNDTDIKAQTGNQNETMGQNLYNSLVNGFNEDTNGDAQNVSSFVTDAFYNVEDEGENKSPGKSNVLTKKNDKLDETNHGRGAVDPDKGLIDKVENTAIEFLDNLNNANAVVGSNPESVESQRTLTRDQDVEDKMKEKVD